MRNNAHMEAQASRLARFTNGSPIEAIETLLNSIANFFNNEISITPNNHQTSLLFLGIHSVALTIAEAFWGKGGDVGYKLFLETFVDGPSDETKYSKIAKEIHDWRNILAHQWLGSMGHHINYDYDMSEGWIRDTDGVLRINPKVYCDLYLKAFKAGGKIWKYEKIFTARELEDTKCRIIDKYIKR